MFYILHTNRKTLTRQCVLYIFFFFLSFFSWYFPLTKKKIKILFYITFRYSYSVMYNLMRAICIYNRKNNSILFTVSGLVIAKKIIPKSLNFLWWLNDVLVNSNWYSSIKFIFFSHSLLIIWYEPFSFCRSFIKQKYYIDISTFRLLSTIEK